jgi:hypothetical protein
VRRNRQWAISLVKIAVLECWPVLIIKMPLEVYDTVIFDERGSVKVNSARFLRHPQIMSTKSKRKLLIDCLFTNFSRFLNFILVTL